MNEDRLLTGPQTAALVGVHVATLYRWMAAGSFPKSVRAGAAAVRWRASEVHEWIASLPANEARAA